MLTYNVLCLGTVPAYKHILQNNQLLFNFDLILSFKFQSADNVATFIEDYVCSQTLDFNCILLHKLQFVELFVVIKYCIDSRLLATYY